MKIQLPPFTGCYFGSLLLLIANLWIAAGSMGGKSYGFRYSVSREENPLSFWSGIAGVKITGLGAIVYGLQEVNYSSPSAWEAGGVILAGLMIVLEVFRIVAGVARKFNH